MKRKSIAFPPILLFIWFSILSCNSSEPKQADREKVDFNNGWAFLSGDAENAEDSSFDDSKWRRLNLPHDWSIEGKFNPDYPAGVGGGALPGGIGWYRKKFTLGDDSTKMIFIDFDGVYHNSEVWINGNLLGKRPNGYISFRYNLTPYLNFGGKENVLAVRVDNSQQPNSRWYSGSGIYRKVLLVKTNPVHVNHWGTYVTTPKVNEAAAKVAVETEIRNSNNQQGVFTLHSLILDADGKEVARASTENLTFKDSLNLLTQEVNISNPHLWSVEDPYLYKVVTLIEQEEKTLDKYETPLGIRYFHFDSEEGFFINGKATKIKGVCLHHDLGALGAAFNTRAQERQLEIMKEMGVNGIRTSHNPPAPELLALCDSMGFIVMDEAFDMWGQKKSDYDYSQHWENWHEQDLKDLVKRDRNHPSIFIWSIGNEIPEQWEPIGTEIAGELAGIVRSLDTTRAITAALNDPEPHNSIYQSGALDLVGFNYHHQNFEEFPEKFPGEKFIATETTSALATRGHYDMPSDSIRRWPIRWDLPFTEGNADNTVSAYDNVSTPWGSTHEETWKLIKKHDYLSGMYIWTGFDYIGEPTPYGWPSRSSYFGVVDLAGFPKDAYYMYKSEWTKDTVLHIFPHWNWEEGKTVDVWAYYNNADEVELFLNGESQGIRKKEGDDLHVSWRLKHEPGTIRAVSRRNNKEVAVKEVKTAGAPFRLVLEADRDRIKADGRDLSFVTVKVLDKVGNLVPEANNLINFEVEGNGFIAGLDNGNPTSLEPFKGNTRKAFNGLALVILQSTGREKGDITLVATSPGLEGARIKIAEE